MKVVTLYQCDEKLIYRIEGKVREEGEFNIGELEAFLEKSRPEIINVILAKPQIIFRRIEFPFKSRRKIQMVIPSEMEETLPEGLENFLFSINFFSKGKGETVVNIYAIHITLFNFWSNLAKKYKAKIFFFSDTLLLFNLLKQYTDGKNHIVIYKSGDYILINVVENGIIVGSYSFTLSQTGKAETIGLIRGILEQKNFPVLICGDRDAQRELEIGRDNVSLINLPYEIEPRYLFHTIVSKKLRMRFIPLVISTPRKVSVASAILFLVFLVFSLLSISPYFKIAEKQRELDNLNNEMKQIFTSTFPDVENVVNPLVQAREKIMKSNYQDIKSGVPSVLKIMADITLLFPDNVDADINVFRIAGNTITLSGTTDSLKTFETIKDRIEKTDKFTIAGIGPISFDTKNRVVFSMTLRTE